MELHPPPVILLLIVIIHCGQTQEKPKPTARVEPQSPVYTGDTVTLTCELHHSSTGWKFQWYKDSQLNHLTGVDENTNTVSITASIRGTGEYKCIARREETYYTDYSDPVTVTVRERPKAKVKVQPAERVFIRERVTLTCDIDGGDVWSYEWLKDNKPLSEAGRRKEYELSNVGQSDGGVYSCKGTQSTQPRYSETSDAVTLTVSETPKPKLISGLKGAALSGNSVVLNCSLDVSAGWKFYWSKHRRIPQNEIKTDTQSYTIRSVNVSDEGQFWCRAGRGNPVYYTQYSDALWINITESPKPVVSIKPDEVVFKGEAVTLRCDIQSGGATEWKYSWFKNNQPSSTYTATQEYRISSVTESDGGKYTCRGERNSDSQSSETSDAVTLTVSEKPKPRARVEPQSPVYTGDTVTLTCELQHSTTGWKFLWYKNSQLNHLTGVDENTSTVSITASIRGTGEYKCIAYRGETWTDDSDPVTVTVRERPKAKVKVQPAERVFIRERVTLTCDIDGGGVWSYEWLKDNKPLSEAGRRKEYELSDVGQSDGGVYSCKGTQSTQPRYSETSDAVTLTVSEYLKPVVSIKPDEVVFKGEAITLRCDIQSGGATEWKYTWFKNNQPSSTNTTTQEYRISPVTESDGGKYTCRGERNSDSQSSETSDAVTLIVSGAAQAVLSASLQSWLTEGDSVTLSCEVRHSSTGWTFSWYRDNEEILSDSRRGAGGSYTLSPAALNHSGVYECRAKRGEPAFHTHNSKPQPLWITGTSPPASLIISPSRTQHFSKQTLSLSCEGQSDSTGWRVRRYTVSGKVSDCSSGRRSATGSTCNISSLSTSHTGVYWCQSESGGRSSPVNITVHNGEVILESPVHPVTDGDPLTLRCLYRSTKPSDLTAHFYRDGSLLGTQTAGEMTISTVSKSAEGLYHCKHAEKGESVKSWISVRFSGPRSSHGIAGLVLGLSLTPLLILVLSLCWCYKKKKGSQSPSAGNQQNTSQSQSLSGPESSLSASTPLQTDDSAAQPSDVMYAQIITIEKKFRGKDASVEPDNVTYAEIELKAKEKEKRKQKRDHLPRGQTTADADTVYSELK